MDVAAALIADRQATEAAQPGVRAFNHPAVATESLRGLDARAGDPWRDAARPQGLAVGAGGVALVRVQFGGARARPTRATTRTADRLDGVDHLLQERSLVDVCGREPDGERCSGPVDHQMALRARFAAIRRIRADLFGRTAPPLAGTDALSMLARLQSIWSASPRRSSTVVCSRCQTPASCHSRKRRQQVIPQPQPSSAGRYSQGIPVFSTNRMPVRQARFGIRGRPPFSFGGSGGSRGSTSAQSSSVTSGFIPLRATSPTPGFC